MAAILVLAVHDVGYMLGHPFWIDEAWVADSVRAPIGRTPFLSSTTPLAWTLLLRLVPFGGPQGLRLIPLGFAGLATGTAYLFGRELRLTRYTTGILMALGVLLSPAMLVRDDLKQYTAEAFVSVLLFLLTSRVESRWSSRRLAAIVVVGSLGLLLANTAIIIGGAVLAGLALECMARQAWRKLAEVAVAGAAMLVTALPIFVVIDRPKMSSALTTYWDGFYLPSNPGSFISTLHADLSGLAPSAGFESLPLEGALLVVGILALLKLGRVALAAALPIVLVTNIVASVADFYPFGDLRTSTYCLTLLPLFYVTAAVMCAKWLVRLDPRLPLATVILAGAAWIAATDSSLRIHPLPDEDVRSQAAYVARHYQPGDAIIVDRGASWGFAYYYHGAKPSFIHDPTAANGFAPAYPNAGWFVVMRGRSESDVASALTAARTRQTSGRIWIVTSHVQMAPDEVEGWQHYLSDTKLLVIPVGSEPLTLYRPS